MGDWLSDQRCKYISPHCSTQRCTLIKLGLTALLFSALCSNSLFYWKYRGWDISTSPSGYGGDCPEGVPVEFGLLSILAAFGAAFGILYMALTIKLGGRRKRQAGSDLHSESCDAQAGSIAGYYGCHLNNFVFGGEDGTYWQQAADLLWHGECWAKLFRLASVPHCPPVSIQTHHRKLKQ